MEIAPETERAPETDRAPERLIGAVGGCRTCGDKVRKLYLWLLWLPICARCFVCAPPAGQA